MDTTYCLPSHSVTSNNVDKKLRFSRPHMTAETGLFEKVHPGLRLQKTPVSGAHNCGYVWMKGQTVQRNTRFQKYPRSCGRPLSLVMSGALSAVSQVKLQNIYYLCRKLWSRNVKNLYEVIKKQC